MGFGVRLPVPVPVCTSRHSRLNVLGARMITEVPEWSCVFLQFGGRTPFGIAQLKGHVDVAAVLAASEAGGY